MTVPPNEPTPGPIDPVKAQALHCAAVYHSSPNGGTPSTVVETARLFEAYLRDTQ